MLVVSLDPGPWSGGDAALLLDHSQDLVFSVRLQPTYSFRYVNAASTPITGYGPDELRADPSIFTEAIHPDDRALVGTALSDARRLEAPVIFRFRHRGG
ncbi:MAG TPA: PAS domain-containing protein, partial [Methanoregulaceae archaeon]|nr:PAS domain-containing protein [Methanoregulaceae archaeon]